MPERGPRSSPEEVPPNPLDGLSELVKAYLNTTQRMGDPDLTIEQFTDLQNDLREYYEQILDDPQLHQELSDFREQQRRQAEERKGTVDE